MSFVTRHAVRESVLWLGLVLSTFFAVFYFDEVMAGLGLADAKTAGSEPDPRIAPDMTEPATVRLFADGHGHFEVAAVVGDHDVDFVIDTGATAVALTYADAKRLGLADNLNFTGTTITANGTSKVAPITIPSIRVGEIAVHGVRAHVAAPGKLGVNLLGMSFIRRLARFEMRGQELVLVK